MADRQSLQEILDRFAHASDQDKTSVAQVMRALGDRSFAANLLIAAATVVSPLSGVPFVSTICGITIAIISAQMLVDRDHLWLPEFLMSKRIKSGWLRQAGKHISKPAGWMDQITQPRLVFLVQQPSLFLSQLICLLCGLAMPFLEILPFTSSIMGTIVCFFAFGMLARDGLFTLLGYGTTLVLPLTLLLLLR